MVDETEITQKVFDAGLHPHRRLHMRLVHEPTKTVVSGAAEQGEGRYHLYQRLLLDLESQLEEEDG